MKLKRFIVGAFFALALTLGADVTTIGAYAFSSCPIQAIYLEGGQAHYNSISFENRFDASDYSGKLVIL